MREFDFRDVIFIEDDSSYFERFSMILKRENLRYFPQEMDSFRKIVSAINFWGRFNDNDFFNELERIVDFFVNKNTVCIIDFQLIPDYEDEYNGLNFYEDFIKGKSRKTIFVSATTLESQKSMIENFCSENENCFFVQKPPHSYSRSSKERFETRIKDLLK